MKCTAGAPCSSNSFAASQNSICQYPLHIKTLFYTASLSDDQFSTLSKGPNPILCLILKSLDKTVVLHPFGDHYHEDTFGWLNLPHLQHCLFLFLEVRNQSHWYIYRMGPRKMWHSVMVSLPHPSLNRLVVIQLFSYLG